MGSSSTARTCGNAAAWVGCCCALMAGSMLMRREFSHPSRPSVTGVIWRSATANYPQSAQYGIGGVETKTKVARPGDVLVIDDDEIMRDLVADWLEAAGYGVRTAGDCPAGLAEVERAEPALIVTDMCMPGPGGDALIRSLKQDHPAVP